MITLNTNKKTGKAGEASESVTPDYTPEQCEL